MNTKPDCSAAGCTNRADVQINNDHLCLYCARPDLTLAHIAAIRSGLTDEHHWCDIHRQVTGEGDICPTCEQLHDDAVKMMDSMMSMYQHSLCVVAQGQTFRVPVYNFADAKVFYSSMIDAVVSSAKIVRHDTLLGKEIVLHTFK